MKRNILFRWLKVMIISMALGGLGVYGIAVPAIGKSIIRAYPEFSGWYLPWLIFLGLVLLPCFAVLVCGWLLTSEIGNGNPFCQKNASLLQAIAALTACDALFFLAGNILFFLWNMNHSAVVIASFFVMAAGIAVSMVFEILHRLMTSAIKLQEENEFTI